MKLLVATFLFFFITNAQLMYAQNQWVQVNPIPNRAIGAIHALGGLDSFIVSGTFANIGVQGYYGNAWFNGTNFHSLNGETFPAWPQGTSFNTINGAAIYKNRLYFGANGLPGYYMEGDSCGSYIIYLENGEWNCTNLKVYSYYLAEFNQKLHVFPQIFPIWPIDTTHVMFYTIDSLFQIDSASIDDQGFNYGERVLCSAEYQGKLYFAGTISPGTGSNGCIMTWDGNSFSIPGGGLSSCNDVVDMVVYNNELILCGGFSHSCSDCNYLIRWDGNQFSSIGSPNWVVKRMILHNGLLFVLGWFTQIDGKNIPRIGYYDGSEWFPLDTNFNTLSELSDFGFIGDTLYVTGHLIILGSDTLKGLIKFNGQLPSGTKLYKSNTVPLSPNPCTTTLTVSSVETPFQYQFYNLHGQEVVSGTSTSKQLNVTALKPGVYFLKVKDRNGTRTGKAVKVEP